MQKNILINHFYFFTKKKQIFGRFFFFSRPAFVHSRATPSPWSILLIQLLAILPYFDTKNFIRFTLFTKCKYIFYLLLYFDSVSWSGATTIFATTQLNSTQSRVSLIFLWKTTNHNQTVSHFISAPTQPNSTKFSMQPYFNPTRRFRHRTIISFVQPLPNSIQNKNNPIGCGTAPGILVKYIAHATATALII